MATRPTSNNPIHAGAGKADDLTQIKGIGPVRQLWLRETFDVRTYQDLASLSPEEIETQLQAEGRTASRSDIETWLAQAQKLAATAEHPVATQELTAERGIAKEPNPQRKAQEWRPLASFGVEFQLRTLEGQNEEYRTTAHHIETANDGPGWPGIESTELCKWMLDQVKDLVKPSMAETKSIEKAPAAAPIPINVAVTQVRVFQPQNILTPTATGNTNQPLQGTINSAIPFALEATFQLSEPPAAGHAQRITYSAQFSVRTRPGRVTLHLGDTEPIMLLTGQSTYSARLSDVSLQPGIYALRIVVWLKGMAMGVGFLEIPLLQVI